jgi:hypothetical protein
MAENMCVFSRSQISTFVLGARKSPDFSIGFYHVAKNLCDGFLKVFTSCLVYSPSLAKSSILWMIASLATSQN